MNELGLVIMDNIKELGKNIDHILSDKYNVETHKIEVNLVKFNNGEGKIELKKSVRGKDIFILSDVGNYSQTYSMYGTCVPMGPTEHFQDIKRVISAINGHASSVTVIMPYLYQSRQDKRNGRESLDCAIALQELENLKIDAIVTFDAHNPGVQNAIPLMPFENFYPPNTILRNFISNKNFKANDLMVISPDTGAMDRARYYADILQVDVGMFYKRRDFTKIINGKNPVVAHEYLGADLKDKDLLIVDDIIASGGSMLEVVEKAHEKGANNIYLSTSFAFFTNGFSEFDEAYQKGLFKKIYTTNLTYISKELKLKKWIEVVDCSIFLSKIIDTLHKQTSLSPLIDQKNEIIKLINENKKEEVFN